MDTTSQLLTAVRDYVDFQRVNVVAAAGTAQTLPSPSVATVSDLTLTASSCALTLPATTFFPVAAGTTILLILRQDATGGRAVTWTSTITWAGAVPALATGPNARTVLAFVWSNGSWTGLGDPATGGGGGGAHPDLLAHDALGLATQAELDTHAATAGHTHPSLAAHDTLGLATQAELNTHAGTPHGGGMELARLIGHSHADSQAVGTTAETTLTSITLGAGEAMVGDILRFHAGGTMLNISGASVNYIHRFKIGASIFALNAIAVASNVNSRKWYWDLQVHVASNSLMRVNGMFLSTGVSSGSSALIVTNGTFGICGDAAESISVDTNFVATVEMSAAHADTNTILRGSSLMVVMMPMGGM